VLEHVLHGLLHAVEVGHLAEHAVRPPSALVPLSPSDVDDQRVVELAGGAKAVEHAADLVVGVLDEAGEDLHLAGEQALLVGAQAVPVLDRRRLGRQLRALRHDAQPIWRASVSSRSVPALVELALPASRSTPAAHGAGRASRPARSR
jgi:hypothetical protein